MVAGEGVKQGPLPESEERGRMDQQVLTGAIGVVFVAVLALSYVRHRRHGGEDEGEDARPAVGIRQTMDETREYFGLSRNDAGAKAGGEDFPQHSTWRLWKCLQTCSARRTGKAFEATRRKGSEGEMTPRRLCNLFGMRGEQ